jgi:acylpyruvate hydrolase
MKLVTYQLDGQSRLGALRDDHVIELKAAYRAMVNDGQAPFIDDMIDLLKEGPAGLERVAGVVSFAETNLAHFVHRLDRVTLLPPVLKPGKIVALGRNYAAHAAEGGAEPPKYPMLFFKPASALLGAGGTIVIPPVTEKVDYEGELAVIIGRTCKQVSPEAALDYVAGYTIANDVSARDLQRRTSQFAAGKMLDTFAPLGPALVTRDEVPEPGNLQIRTRLNGHLMQDANTTMMIFDIPFTISYISQIATLEVGDVILTGTPEGVGFAHTPPVFLKEGDVVSVEIEGLGTLTNDVKNQG